MNVANLQLEGLLMAISSINHLLVQKGLLSADEIDTALRKAEASGTSENRAEEVSPSSRDAINFPIRLLQLANRCQPEADIPSFSELARMVAQIGGAAQPAATRVATTAGVEKLTPTGAEKVFSEAFHGCRRPALQS